MGRPKEFDEEKAVEAAAACFWGRGYDATSVRDLSDAMGICGASLYNTYGDKRALFVAALEHYCNTSMRDRIWRVEAQARGVAAIESFFGDVIGRSFQDRRGCFLVNSALAMRTDDRALRDIVDGYFAELKAFFKRNVLAALSESNERPTWDADAFAEHLLTVLIGVRVLARCMVEKGDLEAAVLPALQALRSLSTDQRGGRA